MERQGPRIDLSGDSPAETSYACGTAARWLPRALAAAVIAAAVLAAFRFDPSQVLTASKYLRNLVALLGAGLAIWVIRKGAELRVRYVLRGDELVLRHGSREQVFRIADLDRLGYETPFAQSRTWVPALVLRDRFGQPWRVPAFLERGDRFLEDLLDRTERNDLRSWAETLGLGVVLSRTSRRVAIGYATAAAIVIGGLVYYAH